MIGDQGRDLAFKFLLAPVGSKIFAIVYLILGMLGMLHTETVTQDDDWAKSPEGPFVSPSLPSC